MTVPVVSPSSTTLLATDSDFATGDRTLGLLERFLSLDFRVSDSMSPGNSLPTEFAVPDVAKVRAVNDEQG